MITCFNRNEDGECLAYNKAQCYPNCPARIKTVDDKINLLECLLRAAQSRKDQRQLEKELESARKVKKAQMEGKYEGWMSCYLEDVHRGEKGGGASEGDSNRSTSLKALMKDNRVQETKQSKEEREQYQEELHQWEEENGKLDRLGRTSMSHSKVDSYIDLPICFSDNGVGTCNGMLTCKGHLDRGCKSCPYLKEGVE